MNARAVKQGAFFAWQLGSASCALQGAIKMRRACLNANYAQPVAMEMDLASFHAQTAIWGALGMRLARVYAKVVPWGGMVIELASQKRALAKRAHLANIPLALVS